MPRRFPHAIAVSELVERFGGSLQGDGAGRELRGVASLAGAGPDDLTFLAAPRLRAQAGATRAGAVFVTAALADALPAGAARIVVDDPQLHFARVARWLVDAAQGERDATRHPSAVVDPLASLGAGVTVGPNAVIERGAVIGHGAVVGANCYVGRDARVGERTVLRPGVTVYEDCVIGARCEVHAGTVIGSDGFGYARSRGRWEKVPQLGRVVIGDDVEIGSNCSIDRGALDDTVIGDGCKLDNLIQVAHNVRIGEHSALAGCVGIAGSAVIGRRCMIGGGVGILGHIEICDDVIVGGMTFVHHSISKPGFYTGAFPMMTNAAWEKAAATVKQLASMRERLRRIERERRAPGPAPENT